MTNRWMKLAGATLVALFASATSSETVSAQSQCDSCEPYDYGPGGGGECLTCTPCGTVIDPIGPCGLDCAQHTCDICSVGSSCSAFTALEPGAVGAIPDNALVTYSDATPLAIKICAIALAEQEEWLAAERLNAPHHAAGKTGPGRRTSAAPAT